MARGTRWCDGRPPGFTTKYDRDFEEIIRQTDLKVDVEKIQQTLKTNKPHKKLDFAERVKNTRKHQTTDVWFMVFVFIILTTSMIAIALVYP